MQLYNNLYEQFIFHSPIEFYTDTLIPTLLFNNQGPHKINRGKPEEFLLLIVMGTWSPGTVNYLLGLEQFIITTKK